MLTTQYMGTRIYEMAVELAEQYTDDFDQQEEFIERLLWAYATITEQLEEKDG